MILTVKKGIRGPICHFIYRYTKANNKCIKDCDENKESLYLEYWDVNNLDGGVMSQKPPVKTFE